jgi:hypothetical protein
LPTTQGSASRTSWRIALGLFAVLVTALAVGCGSSSSTTGSSTSGKNANHGLKPGETLAPPTASSDSSSTTSSSSSGTESSSAEVGEATAEIVSCSSNSEGFPVAKVRLKVAKEDPRDPSYTVSVIFLPVTGAGTEDDDIFGVGLTTVTTATGTVEATYPDEELENVPVTCAISSVKHLENLNGKEQDFEIQGEGRAVPQS